MMCTLLSKEGLSKCGEYYDSKEHLICRPIEFLNNISVHKKTYARLIHQSIEYAMYLLDSDPIKNIGKAIDIISAVLENQDRQKNSQKYGNWGYFLEKKLIKGYFYILEGDTQRENGRMAASIVQILMHYGEYLPHKLYKELMKSLVDTIYTFRNGYKENLNMNAILVQVYAIYGYISMCKNDDLMEFGKKCWMNYIMLL